jgi:hypothetical protein
MYRASLTIFCLVAGFLSGCADQGSNPVSSLSPVIDEHPYLIPGVVSVVFADTVTLAQAEQFILDLHLTFKFSPLLDVRPLILPITVPIDSEDFWVEKLKTYTLVKPAGRIGVRYSS